MVQNSPSPRRCARCGAELPANVPPELCPKCLLKLAMVPQAATGPEETALAQAIGSIKRGLPQPGERLGHYEIARPLGSGGMGAVFEATDLENGRRVALKVLSQALDSPDARERFLREGRLAASLNHPNSVYVFGTEEIGGTPVIAMELMAGGTLQDRVRAQGPLPIGEAVDCVLQIIEGLDAAQRVGILHRDVKPSNCYLAEDGTVKIGDFGLSISTAVRTEPALTARGTFLGTPAFSSPEQLRGEELNPRSDMYSVGATLYYLLTGHTPFEAENLVQLLATVLEQRPPSATKFRSDIPAGLAKVLLRCLEKQPGERFKSYGDLARALAPYGSIAPTPATLGLRFLAGVVDMTFLGGLSVLINLSVFGTLTAFMDQVLQRSPKVLVSQLGCFCAMTLYYALCEGWWGAAIGKAFCRLRVVGPARNPPGFARAWLRALVYITPPILPYWLAYGINPRAYMSSSTWLQLLMGLSTYGFMALLFVTARRRNGFAAVQDLLTGTRVVSRAALGTRPAPLAGEPPSALAESALTVGPYHVLQTLADSAVEKWFLGYDLKLLRKVWIRTVPPGTPSVPASLRDLGRVGRLRWLTGKRSPEENWDAFEALTGRSFLELSAKPQRWSELRYWLHDLAVEISAAQRDGTLPELDLDRLWITSDGRVKLLDFPAPGLTPTIKDQPSTATSAAPPQLPPFDQATTQACNSFLSTIAATALTGCPGTSANTASNIALPLPLHARDFLKRLPELAGAEAIAAALKPLLRRVAVVSRLRRAALLAGCIAFPALSYPFSLFGLSAFEQFNRQNPGLMELSTLLQARASAGMFRAAKARWPSDRLVAVYIAHHYRGLITNEAVWSSAFSLTMVKGEGRKFAEQSVAEHSAPTEAEIKEADAALKKLLPTENPFSQKPPPWLPSWTLLMMLAIYIGAPAVIAALLFRGGLVLLIAGVTYVTADGALAGRLRLLWRAIVTWGPVFLALFISAFAAIVHAAKAKDLAWLPWVALAVVGLLAALSVALPERGLQDRLAGTWPVPR